MLTELGRAIQITGWDSLATQGGSVWHLDVVLCLLLGRILVEVSFWDPSAKIRSLYHYVLSELWFHVKWMSFNL